MKRQIIGIVLSLTFFTASPLFAQTKVSGLVFGDYYAIASNHNEGLENLNGFLLRRAYVTFDHKFDDRLSARIRFEANSPGDLKTASRIDPYIKHLYLDWKVRGSHSLLLGLSGPPTYAVVEEIWGYRHLEKTPLDLYGFGPSSDFGVALKGSLGSNLKYHGMVSNGSGTNAETNSGKKASFSLGYYPLKSVVVEGYMDTETRPDNARWKTYQFFSAFKNNSGRVGFLLARQARNEALYKNDMDLASVFAIYGISSKFNLVGRYDRMLDPNPNGERIAYLPFSPKAKSNLTLLGLDYQAAKNINFIPNLEYVAYDGIEPAPKKDLIYRLTFYFSF